jgi:hypothetical protein
VAVRTLPPSLFLAKARAPLCGCSTPYLHFIASVRHERNQYALVCENQPLATFRSHGLPDRCPACGAQIHFKEKANANQQGQRR